MELQGLPHWAGRLQNYYVVIRVDGRNKTVRRRYYRAVEREKYRLACLGICQRQIIACCRYLASLSNRRNGSSRQAELMHYSSPQMAFDFT
jgi:hypothetical protein